MCQRDRVIAGAPKFFETPAFEIKDSIRESDRMNEYVRQLPTVALRGLTILPGMVAHFDMSREKSIKAVEASLTGDSQIFLVTQKDINENDPKSFGRRKRPCRISLSQ